MTYIIGVFFILLGVIFIVWSVYKRPGKSLEIDLRVPGRKIQLQPYGNLPFGIILSSFGLLLVLYPITVIGAHIISIAGICFGLGLYFKRLFKAVK